MFCPKCGKEIADAQKFCPECGANIAAPSNGLLEGLSKKIKIEAYVWLGVAAAQVVIGLYNIIIGFIVNAELGEGTTNIVSGLIILAVAVSNALNSKKDLQYSKDIFNAPKGIVEKYKPIKGLIITLVYNAVLGGTIGVVGSIFGFLTRKYVVDNEAAFLALETAEVA